MFVRFCAPFLCLFAACSSVDSTPLPERVQCKDQAVCVNVWRCPHFAGLLQRTTVPRPRPILYQIKKNFCGLANETTPKVCCPKLPGPLPAVSTEAAHISRRIDQQDDLTQHRNFKLLPMDICGPVSYNVKITSGVGTVPGEFPWMVLIAYKKGNGKADFKCGGTLINERYVLTAAHCIDEKSILGVRLGEHNLLTDPDCDDNLRCAPPVQDTLINKVIVHPLYNRTTFVNDIALIKLAIPVDFSFDHVQPICLPFGQQYNLNLIGKNLIATGWGVTEKGDRSAILLKVTIPVLARQSCIKIYNNFKPITPNQICAGGFKGRDSCAGDSGGPLKYLGWVDDSRRFVQYGIVSYGPKYCGIEGLPGIYTRVEPYLLWILDNLDHP